MFDSSAAVEVIMASVNQVESSDGTHICALCKGSGDNTQGLVMQVNDHICVRCGGYGHIPRCSNNPPTLTDEDFGYALSNGWNGRLPL